MSRKPFFRRTSEALKAYDASKDDRAMWWHEATDLDDVRSAEEQDKHAEDLVRDAFVLDTQDVNQEAQARLIHPDDPWLRRLVELKDEL